MRSIIKFFGRIPAGVKKAAARALHVTTKLLQVLESNEAIIITQLIPGDVDDHIRLAMIGILNAFKPALEMTQGTKPRKALAGRLGAELTALQDGHRERMGQYAIWFEQVYGREER